MATRADARGAARQEVQRKVGGGRRDGARHHQDRQRLEECAPPPLCVRLRAKRASTQAVGDPSIRGNDRLQVSVGAKTAGNNAHVRILQRSAASSSEEYQQYCVESC